MQSLASLLSYQSIAGLPWYVGMPGLAAIALLLFSAAKSLLMLRPLKALFRVVLAFAVAVILSGGGAAIAQWIGGSAPS